MVNTTDTVSIILNSQMRLYSVIIDDYISSIIMIA